MFESLGRGCKMIGASLHLGWQDKRLFLPSVLTVFTNFCFGILLMCQGMAWLKGNEPAIKHIGRTGHHLLQHVNPAKVVQWGSMNGLFDPSGWGMGSFSDNAELGWLSLAIISVWWLTNRFLEGVTTALVYSNLTEGKGSGKFFIAAKAVFSSLPAIICLGIATFVAKTIARFLRHKQSPSILGFGFGFLAGMVQVFWTLAGHLLLPAIVIEGSSFWGALKRADKIASSNLLTIGFGEVGVDAICRLITLAVGTLGVAGFAYAQLNGILHTPAFLLAAFLWVILVVLITASSIYLRAAFYTCLYVWAIEAETAMSQERRLVSPPRPLAMALA